MVDQFEDLRLATLRKTMLAAGFKEDCIYGFPSVKNPFNFSPDYECCSEKEIEQWKMAKEQWRKGKSEVGGNKCRWLGDPDKDKFAIHIAATDWGLGVSNIWMNEETGEVTEDLDGE